MVSFFFGRSYRCLSLHTQPACLHNYQSNPGEIIHCLIIPSHAIVLSGRARIIFRRGLFALIYVIGQGTLPIEKLKNLPRFWALQCQRDMPVLKSFPSMHFSAGHGENGKAVKMMSLRVPIILALIFLFIAVYVQSRRKMKHKKRRS